MGDRIRGFDWSKSPLGALEAWPSTLLSTLNICLSARFPMAIYWGGEGHLLYNDAWQPILGNKHPWAMGRPAREVWPEIWPNINPLFEAVRATGQATWRPDELLPMERFGYREECYFDYSFNPIIGQSRTNEGILNIVQETTFRVLNERRTRLLSELAARSATSKTVQQACEFAIGAIATDPKDVPFAMLCVLEATGGFRTIASTGLTVNPPAKFAAELPPFAALKPDGKPVVVEDFVRQFELSPAPVWPEPVTQAVLLPVISTAQKNVTAVLIAGVSPRRQLDADYLRFFELIASHVVSTLANAKTLEDERQRAETLAELDRAKTTFFGNVSHELRTPLTLILGPLEEKLREPGGSDERLQLAHRNSVRLLKLVNTLLDFSRIEAGRAEASFEPVDLAAFTAELAGVFRSAFERAGLHFQVDCPPLPEPVFVDREMWEKIVFNLLSNAFKFTLQGEIEVRLRVSENAPAGGSDGLPAAPSIPCACLSVRDTGTGIPAAELPRIFERFHRVRNPLARSHEGTGIGLALVQELARQHGGCVEVASTEGSGTTFSVWIPLGSSHLPPDRIGAGRNLISTNSGSLPFVEESLRWLPHDTAAPAETPSPPTHDLTKAALAGHGSNGTKTRILLADDNSDMRDYIHRLLTARGYEVVSVDNGEAALTAILAHPPALVLSDVMMPRLDGFGLLRELRANPATAAIPIILISARAGEEARVEGVEAGADDYLTKPFGVRELLARISTHLDLARLRREAAEKITTTLESITDGLHVIDSDRRLTYLNAAARRMITENGLDPRGMLGRDFFEVFPATLNMDVGRALQRSLLDRVPTEAEDFYAPWQRWFSVRHYPLAEGGVSTFFQDVTERRRAEAILRENEALFSALVDLAPMGVYVVDSEFRLQQINARALPAFEKVQRAVGRDFAEVMEVLWGAELAAEIIKIFRHTLATGERYVSPRFSEFRQDLGEERTYEWETRRMTLPDGRHGVVCYFNDITENTRIEQSLREAKAAAEAANRSKDLFLAALSHELRTPLTPVLMTATNLQEDERLPADVREQLRMMERNIELEARLIDDLLDISAIAVGKLRLQNKFCDTHSLIQLAMEMVRDTALTREIRIGCELNASCSGIMTDPARFQQIVWNLLRNAVKFTPRAGNITVRTGDFTGPDGQAWLRIEVSDSGIGIEPGLLEKIFQPFEQGALAGEHRFGGLGLGLAIARAIVELHAGKISARSAGRGKGATFIVEFPGARPFAGISPRKTVASKTETSHSQKPSAPRNILLVEDHPSTLQVLTLLLGRSGYIVAPATTVTEALALAANQPFDLVVSDLGLPDGTGVQLMEKLRSRHGLRGIALTGYGMEEDIARAREAGFVAHLVKPVQISELRRVLAALS